MRGGEMGVATVMLEDSWEAKARAQCAQIWAGKGHGYGGIGYLELIACGVGQGLSNISMSSWIGSNLPPVLGAI